MFQEILSRLVDTNPDLQHHVGVFFVSFLTVWQPQEELKQARANYGPGVLTQPVQLFNPARPPLCELRRNFSCKTAAAKCKTFQLGQQRLQGALHCKISPSWMDSWSSGGEVGTVMLLLLEAADGSSPPPLCLQLFPRSKSLSGLLVSVQGLN